VSPAVFENVQVPDNVRFDIGMWIFERISNAGLGSQMYDVSDSLSANALVESVAFREINVAKGKAGEWFELHQPIAFQLRVIVAIQIVDSDDALTALQETPCNVISDEATRSGYEVGHGPYISPIIASQ
jgi:hypothetical protein